MIFNTWVYALFLIVSVATYWLVPVRARPCTLIGFGIYFYWYYYPPHAPLILVFTLIVFGLSFLVQPGRSKRQLWFAVGVAGSIALLTYYKYQGFIADSFNFVLGLGGTESRVTPTSLIVPLAISFFTFEFVHYLIEVHRGTFRPASLRNFLLFIMFFPTLICGPIKRFQLFDPEEYARKPLDPELFAQGLERILFGLAKKTLIADTVAPWAMPVFEHPELYGWGGLWLGVYGYALQIYFDFAGYSDIAIGSAMLFGYPVPENFNYPYLQTNIARFWHNWHMSLTSWITDYVYIPLGGNRHGEWRSYLNRFLAMTICGLWHGAAFHFAVWGMYHGLGLNLYRAWQTVRERVFGPRQGEGSLVGRIAAGVFTFHFVCIGWVLFVCDLDRAGLIVGRLLWLC